jgi:hypothetical protein
MMNPATVLLLVAAGIATALVVLLTSSGLFGFYVLESIRRILRLTTKRGNSTPV